MRLVPESTSLPLYTTGGGLGLIAGFDRIGTPLASLSSPILFRGRVGQRYRADDVVGRERPKMHAFLADLGDVHARDEIVRRAVEHNSLGRLVDGEAFEYPLAGSFEVHGVSAAGTAAVEHSGRRTAQGDRLCDCA